MYTETVTVLNLFTTYFDENKLAEIQEVHICSYLPIPIVECSGQQYGGHEHAGERDAHGGGGAPPAHRRRRRARLLPRRREQDGRAQRRCTWTHSLLSFKDPMIPRRSKSKIFVKILYLNIDFSLQWNLRKTFS